MPKNIVKLHEVTPLAELSMEELKSKLKNLKDRYKMAVSRFEFIFAPDLKEDIRKVIKEIEARKLMRECV